MTGRHEASAPPLDRARLEPRPLSDPGAAPPAPRREALRPVGPLRAGAASPRLARRVCRSGSATTAAGGAAAGGARRAKRAAGATAAARSCAKVGSSSGAAARRWSTGSGTPRQSLRSVARVLSPGASRARVHGASERFGDLLRRSRALGVGPGAELCSRELAPPVARSPLPRLRAGVPLADDVTWSAHIRRRPRGLHHSVYSIDIDGDGVVDSFLYSARERSSGQGGYCSRRRRVARERERRPVRSWTRHVISPRPTARARCSAPTSTATAISSTWMTRPSYDTIATAAENVTGGRRLAARDRPRLVGVVARAAPTSTATAISTG